MASRISILGGATPTGACYWAPLSVAMAAQGTARDQRCLVMPNPAADDGCEGVFMVPDDYSSAPVLRIVGILDGAVTGNIAFGMKCLALADNEGADAAYSSEDIASAAVTGHTIEDLYHETISLSTPTFAAGDTVLFDFYRDDNVDTYAQQFLLLGLYFEYTAA